MSDIASNSTSSQGPRMARGPATPRPRGWWYPYIFVGMFGIVLAVNLTLFYFATSTFTGLETIGAYEKGLKYNQSLAAAQRQAKMGWTVTPSFTRTAAGDRLEVVFRDRDGLPLHGLTVRALVVRPTVQGYDQRVDLTAAGDGRYAATLTLPLRGQWDVTIHGALGDLEYNVTERMVVD